MALRRRRGSRDVFSGTAPAGGRDSRMVELLPRGFSSEGPDGDAGDARGLSLDASRPALFGLGGGALLPGPRALLVRRFQPFLQAAEPWVPLRLAGPALSLCLGRPIGPSGGDAAGLQLRPL